MKDEKSSGTTASEQYLASLCTNSFLSFWSYPNLFRDQGRPEGKGDGKELCDLLVVFSEDVIIFSDKSCNFPDTGDEALDWRRWFKRAIQKSSEQVFGAERWIREHPEKIYLDAACTRPFPLAFPSIDQCRFHRVVVALNASARCKAFFSNSGSGSLMIVPPLVGSAHEVAPFSIGNIDPAKGYIHVLDDYTLDVILRELDTISDFTQYLIRKERFIASGKLIAAAGDEELLGHYLTHTDARGEHDFVFPEKTNAVWLTVRVR